MKNMNNFYNDYGYKFLIFIDFVYLNEPFTYELEKFIEDNDLIF